MDDQTQKLHLEDNAHHDQVLMLSSLSHYFCSIENPYSAISLLGKAFWHVQQIKDSDFQKSSLMTPADIYNEMRDALGDDFLNPPLTMD